MSFHPRAEHPDPRQESQAEERREAGGRAAEPELTLTEREELPKLRARVRELALEKDILRKAVQYFAKEMGQRPAATASSSPSAPLTASRGCAGSRGCAARASTSGWTPLGLAPSASALAGEFTAIHVAQKRAYGSPRVTVELRRRGRRVNRKKVERLMREPGIVGSTRRRRRSLTKQDVAMLPAPDLLGRDFTAAAPGEKLVGDITYLPCIWLP